jgi:hypothetical protein
MILNSLGIHLRVSLHLGESRNYYSGKSYKSDLSPPNVVLDFQNGSALHKSKLADLKFSLLHDALEAGINSLRKTYLLMDHTDSVGLDIAHQHLAWTMSFVHGCA